MAKLQDKFFNRVIEGNLKLEANEQNQVNDLAEEVATELVEGGTLDNAKPIYYHPIYFQWVVSSQLRIVCQCSILDNNPTAYTILTFKTKVKSLMDNGAIINCNGALREDGTSNFATLFMMIKAGSSYNLQGFRGTDSQIVVSLDDITSAGLLFIDGVNKIN